MPVKSCSPHKWIFSGMHRNSCITCCCVLCIWLICSTEVSMQSQSLVLFWRDVYLLLNPRQPRRSVSDRVCWFVSARCEGFFSWPGEWQLCYSLKRQLFLDLCWEELVFSTVKCEWRTIERHEENHSQRGFSLISHAWHTLERVKRAHWVTVQKRHHRCVMKRSSANLRPCGGKQPRPIFCFERSWG